MRFFSGLFFFYLKFLGVVTLNILKRKSVVGANLMYLSKSWNWVVEVTELKQPKQSQQMNIQNTTAKN